MTVRSFPYWPIQLVRTDPVERVRRASACACVCFRRNKRETDRESATNTHTHTRFLLGCRALERRHTVFAPNRDSNGCSDTRPGGLVTHWIDTQPRAGSVSGRGCSSRHSALRNSPRSRMEHGLLFPVKLGWYLWTRLRQSRSQFVVRTRDFPYVNSLW